MNKPFIEVFDDCTKYAKKIQTADFLKKGKYAIIDQSQEYISGYANNEEGLYNKYPVIIFGDHTRIIKYIDFPFFLGADGTKILQPKTQESDCKYLFYFLLNAKIPNTGYNRHYKWLKELDVPIPPFDEQKKIANELDKITDIITKRETQIKKLDLLIKAKFVEMFGDPVENPMGWKREKLSDYFKVTSSKRIYQTELTTIGVPFFKISDLVKKIKGSNIVKTDVCISEVLYNELKNKGLVPCERDILLTSRGTLGECYIVKSNDKFYFQDGMISWLIKNNTNLNNIYFIHLFYTNDIKQQLETDSSGATVDYISINKIKELKIMIPPLALQTQFADYVEKIEATKTKMQAGLAQLETLYKSQMQKYFK